MRGMIYTTGEFAKLCETTKNTLFLYDRKGILKPSIKGENGYRYYSKDQYTTFVVIGILKDIGCSLAEIKEKVSGCNRMELLRFFEEKRSIISEKQKKLASAQSFIDRTIASAQSPELNSHRLIVKYCPEEYLITAAYNFEKKSEENYPISWEALEDFSQYLKKRGYEALGGGDIISLSEQQNGICSPVYYYKKISYKPEDPALKIKPMGIYASMYFENSWDNIFECCSILLDEVNKTGSKPTGYIYVEDVIFTFIVGDPEKYGYIISVMTE